jgi:hypothetical protein
MSVHKVPLASLRILPKYSSQNVGTPFLAALQAFQLAFFEQTHIR